MSRIDFLSSLDLPTLHTPGDLVVVEEIGHGIDANFATHFLLRDFILQQKQGGADKEWTVVLVTTTQSGRHWSDIATKLGWNFGAMQKQGHLQLIDLIEEEWNMLSSSSDKVDDDKDKNLFTLISNALPNNANSGPNLILIEDLSALLYSQEMTERTLIEFIFKLKRLAKNHNATLLTLVHSSSSSQIVDVEGDRVAALISQNYANICLTISPLSTGTSAQITGHLQVKHHPKLGLKNNDNREIRKSRLAQYKLDERNVRVNFIPGA